MSYRLISWFLFALFVMANSVYLERVPGLMGDEGSEGENVYELTHADSLVITGERSYIGPLIDYVRVPFMAVFGYTTLAVRLPVLLFSIATFWLALFCLRSSLGETAALYGLVALTFSPIYIAHQRLGWTISLFPFCIFLIWALGIRFRDRSSPYLPLLFGLAAGLALANHVLFLPSLVALAIVFLLTGMWDVRKLVSAWPALIGFWAGFAMQFVVMLLIKEDQGEPATNATLFLDRLHDLPSAWPLFLSGSSYVAHYTGLEFSRGLTFALTGLLLLLALFSWLSLKRSKAVVWLWIWAAVYWPVLLLMIDRFSLRYFLVGSLWLWLMAGIGLSELLTLVRLPERIRVALPLCLAVILSGWACAILFIPYLRSGGSTANFSLGNRNDSASALVDVRPLLACLDGRGSVFSENVHIYNRLQYLSHSDERLQVMSEDQKEEADVLVVYRLPDDEGKSRGMELCPELTHFKVTAR